MGASSSSAQQTEQHTENTQNTLSGGGSVLASGGSNVLVETSDPTVTKAAIGGIGELALAVVNNSSGVTSTALANLSDLMAQNLQAQAAARADSVGLLEKSLATTSSLASNVQSNGGDQMSALIKVLLYVAAGLAALFFFIRK